MQQMVIDEELVIPLDYDSPELPGYVRQFRPTLYAESDLFICVLGPDPEQAIYGRGVTEDEAIQDWEAAFKERLTSKGDNDAVAQYIKDTIATSKKDVW